MILEEMSMYQDAPEDAIIDDFDTVVFGDHPLGVNILGTRESVSRFQTADFHAFLQEQMRTDRLVFSSVSNLPFEAVKKLPTNFWPRCRSGWGRASAARWVATSARRRPKPAPFRRRIAWWAARPTR